MTAVYLNIMGKLDINFPVGRSDVVTVVGRIRGLLKEKSEGHPVLLLLDN